MTEKILAARQRVKEQSGFLSPVLSIFLLALANLLPKEKKKVIKRDQVSIMVGLEELSVEIDPGVYKKLGVDPAVSADDFTGTTTQIEEGFGPGVFRRINWNFLDEQWDAAVRAQQQAAREMPYFNFPTPIYTRDNHGRPVVASVSYNEEMPQPRNIFKMSKEEIVNEVTGDLRYYGTLDEFTRNSFVIAQTDQKTDVFGRDQDGTSVLLATVDFAKEEIRQYFPGALMPEATMSFKTFNEWINRPMAFDGYCTPSRRPMTGVYLGAQETGPQCACLDCRASI